MKTAIKTISFLYVLSFLFFYYGCSGTSPEYQNYENQLSTQMQDMINVLNAGHYNQFMRTYVDPTYISSKGGVDKALLQFDNKRQTALFNALKIAKNIQPLYDQKTKELTYISTNLARPIVFKLVNGKWYLESDWLK